MIDGLIGGHFGSNAARGLRKPAADSAASDSAARRRLGLSAFLADSADAAADSDSDSDSGSESAVRIAASSLHHWHSDDSE